MSCVEYVCISCGHFAGSTRPVICDNPKCKNPTVGFQIEWDERADFERELTVDDEGENNETDHEESKASS